MYQKYKAFYRSLFTATRYNMTTSEEFQYVWFRVAKVGTRSMLNNLKSIGELKIDDSFQKFDEEIYKDFYKFAFVRNPWDRLVSTYQDKVIGEKMFRKCWNKDFNYFVNYVSEFNLKYADRHIRPQTCLIPEQVDFIGRFESLSNDYYQLLKNLGINSEPLPHKNKTIKKDFKDFYDDPLIEIVYNLYKEDIERFSYIF